MRVLIGCGLGLAFVAFLIGFVATLFLRDISWFGRLALAAMPAGITFVAALLSGSRDFVTRRLAHRAVRQRLLATHETGDEQFVRERSTDDAELLLETRRAIARYFSVPPERIRRDVRPREDLQFERLGFEIVFYVVGAVLRTRQGADTPFRFQAADFPSLDDFVAAIRKSLNEGA